MGNPVVRVAALGDLHCTKSSQGAFQPLLARIGESADAPTLLDFVAADPVGMLGPEIAARFKNRLPFLLKVLAADQALSIQTHPTRAQAEAGFAAENGRGVPAKDPVARNRYSRPLASERASG